jgi:hypothetical protein
MNYKASIALPSLLALAFLFFGAGAKAAGDTVTFPVSTQFIKQAIQNNTQLAWRCCSRRYTCRRPCVRQCYTRPRCYRRSSCGSYRYYSGCYNRCGYGCARPYYRYYRPACRSYYGGCGY